MHALGIGVLSTAALLLISFSKETEYTAEQRACIAQRYQDYDPKKIDRSRL